MEPSIDMKSSRLCDVEMPLSLKKNGKNDNMEIEKLMILMKPFHNSRILQDILQSKLGLLIGDDISLGLSSMVVCFDFLSTNVVQLSNRNP